jgi:alkylation response protein AidB-like acyl-CoA dehydrogenase
MSSHLIFDRRDWKFILTEQFDLPKLLKNARFSDFDAETIEQIVDEGVRFAVDVVAPINTPGDVEGCKVENGFVTAPKAYGPVYRELCAAGWPQSIHSAEFGGQQIPLFALAPVFEAMNGACQAFFMYTQLTGGAGHLIETFGSDKLKKLFVEKMYSGVWGGTMCLTEPNAGSAVGDLKTSAQPVGDGRYLIEGNKIFISGGDADFYGNVCHLVLARVKGDPAGIKGVSLFVVPKYWVNDDGSLGEFNHAYVEGIEHKMGINGSSTCQLSFGARGPTYAYMVGEPCSGIVYMFQLMNEARVMCGVQGNALANAAYQRAVAYAKDRKQGPEVENLAGESVEIIRHPDVRRNLMLMKCYSEGCRSLIAASSWWTDVSSFGDDPAEREHAQNMLDLMVPIVKAYSTDKGFKVTELGVQVYGGYGYCRDYPMEQYLRDVKIASIYEGTNGIQALDLLGRKMRLKGGALFMQYVMELSQFVEANRSTEGLGDTIAVLGEAQQALGEVAFWLASLGKAGVRHALLQATPFLELFGDVAVGHQIAHQAVIAAGKLKERIGSATATAAQRAEDPEVAFYAGKLDSARFFASEVVMLVPAKARAIQRSSTAANDMVWA